MTRPVRIQFENALYHITSRGDRREAIYEDDTDRLAFLKILGDVIRTYNWICHAYCLMSNHYHLVIETPDANLSKGMRQLNGVYTQVSNRRHGRAGHLFQGRYKAILVDGDSYFLALNRYVVLNPVRAGMVAEPNDWPWSSYPAMIGDINSPKWLCTDSLLAQFSTEREKALHRYARFVGAGIGEESIWEGLNRQIYLGNEGFIKRVQSSHAGLSKTVGVPKTQKRPPAPSLEKLAARYANRDEGIVAAYATGSTAINRLRNFMLFIPRQSVKSCAGDEQPGDG